MNKGDGKAKAWLAKFNALESKSGNISATGHLQETLAIIKEGELLSKQKADFYGSPWPDRYEAEWAMNMRSGNVFAESLAKAWVGAMNILDKKMQQDIKKLASLSASKQKAERERLKALVNGRFWDALKLQPLMESDVGQGFHIACYTVNITGIRNPNAFDVALDRWSELQTIWNDALDGKSIKTAKANQAKSVQQSSSQAVDQEKPSTETTKEAYLQYIAAYNKLTSLMAAGKGDTPAGKAAYQNYVKQKKAYEAIIRK